MEEELTLEEKIKECEESRRNLAEVLKTLDYHMDYYNSEKTKAETALSEDYEGNKKIIEEMTHNLELCKGRRKQLIEVIGQTDDLISKFYSGS